MAENQISEQKLKGMIDRSAITCYKNFNRRYFQWFMKLVGEKVEALELATTLVIGKGSHPQYEDHPNCDGAGCAKCGWSGEQIRMISDKTPLPQESARYTTLKPPTSRKQFTVVRPLLT